MITIITMLCCAAYHHTGCVWLLYPIYLGVAKVLMDIIQAVATWVRYLGDAIVAHANAIKNKKFDVSLKADNRHSGTIRNS